ncbi:hypothetical protein GCM10010430_78810 [Kitasatospora cystarginea]|uniref:Uncharacterized protein n=1 Tax=Kitasatospora cystarginea TaxID=58350 RepID=A0ABN3F134_9ACTN
MGFLLLALADGLALIVGGTVVRVLQRLDQAVPAGAAEPPPHRPERPVLGKEFQRGGDDRHRVVVGPPAVLAWVEGDGPP